MECRKKVKIEVYNDGKRDIELYEYRRGEDTISFSVIDGQVIYQGKSYIEGCKIYTQRILEDREARARKRLRGTREIYLGKMDGEPQFLSLARWDCGWYWGFGYVGNTNNHGHWSSIIGKANLLDEVMTELSVEKCQLWVLSELMASFYILQKTAEFYLRGGAHISKNPLQSTIQNRDEADRINKTLIPEVIKEVYKILLHPEDAEKAMDELKKQVERMD